MYIHNQHVNMFVDILLLRKSDMNSLTPVYFHMVEYLGKSVRSIKHYDPF